MQCEACHGPGSVHAAYPMSFEMKVDRAAEQCGECHYRGVIEEVDASNGLIRHHEQYEELFQSKHITLDCVICHDPHDGVVQLRESGEQTTRTSCENCHWEQAKVQNNDRHTRLRVDCISCHMPRVTKSAVGNADLFTGDIRTHLMAIDPDQIEQFSEDGSVVLSQLGLNFACRTCHNPDGIATEKSDEELSAAAGNYHVPAPPVPEAVAEPEVTASDP